MFHKVGKVLLASGASCLVLAMASGARAQDATTSASVSTSGTAHPSLADSPAATQHSQVEDIVVTGQKRATRLQKVAATVVVVSGKSLAANEVRSFSQLAKLVPGFNFEKSQGGNQVLSIRGVGTTSAGQSLEQSVAAYINGVYMGGNLREFATPLYDLAQVEVLKGTQSGIAGQNTSVGALNIVTNGATDTFGGYISAGHEFNYDGYNAEGAINIPITPKLDTRFSALYEKVGGWVHDVATGEYTGGNENYSVRNNTLLHATDDLTVRLYVEYDKGSSLSNLVVPFGTPSFLYSTFIPGLQSANSKSSNFSSRGIDGGNDFYNFEELRGSLTVDYDLGGPILTSVTGGSHIRDTLGVDGDNSPLDLSWLAQSSKYGQIHQEFRLVSPSTDRLTYIVGMWYRHSNQNKAINFYLDIPPPPPPVGLHFAANIPFLQTTDTGSVFADVHYAVTPKLTIGGTGRYTYEQKTGQIAVNSNWPFTFVQYPQTSGRLTPSFVDGSATAQYSPSKTSMVYALYAHGTKTGAFVDLADSLLALRPEVTDTFEIGTKLTFRPENLTTNFSAFRMNVANYQDVFAILANGVTSFAAQNRNLHTEGVEFQANWQPIPAFTLGTAGTLLDSHDQTGGDAARAPHVTVTANARYEFELPNEMKVAIYGNVLHSSSYLNNVTLPNPDFTKSPPYTIADLGIEAYPRPNLVVRLLVQNVTNEHAYQVVNASSVDPTQTIGALLPLRRVFLSGTYHF